jgi:hypothetical protein
MRRLPAALVALTAAATLTLFASPASAAGGPRSFKTDADTVRAGQQIKVWGKGCRSQGYVHIYLDGKEITNDRADRAGVFVHYAEIPIATSPGEHTMKAGCNGYGLGSFKITIRGARFNVTPRSVKAGNSVTVRGNLCKPGSYVTIKLATELIGEDRANDKGNFIGGHRIPSDTPEGVYSVSARCHAKFVGSQLTEVKPDYPAQENLLTTDRTAVPAGQAVTINGTKCPTGKPSATLDGQRLNLAVNRNGKGFTATATIPAGATPGKHTLSASCEAGSSGTTVLHVSEAAQPAAAKLVFGTQPPSNLALWAALFAGIAVLVASVGITTRRRRQQ